MLTDVVDLDDVRVPQLSDGLRLDAEAADLVRPRQQGVADHLERDEAVEPFLLGLVDHAHAAPAQFAQDFIALDFGQRRGRQRNRRRDQRSAGIGGNSSAVFADGFSGKGFPDIERLRLQRHETTSESGMTELYRLSHRPARCQLMG